MAETPSGYDEDFVNAVEDDVQCLICHLPLKETVLTRCGHRFCKECLGEHFRRSKMLETESTKLPCGYEEHFTIPVDDDLQCFICHLPLREPVLTRCGHRFCRQCLEKHLASQESQQQECSCPVDREVLGRQKDIFPDKATERKILSFAIKCSSDGCDWTGELRKSEDHLSSCSFKLVSCTNENCEVTIHRKELEEHVTSSCQWRIVLCDHCNESHPKCLIQDHVENKCEKKPVECPNRCGKVIVREEIASHTNNDCPLSIVSCPYVHMGCNSKIQRKKLESHLQSKIGHHLHVACTTFKETTGKLEEKVKALQRRQEKLEQEKLALQMQVQELRAGKVVLDAKMAVQEKEASELKSESSGFVWKISGFTEVLQQAMKDDNVKIYSSPFSTGPHGYKLIVGMKPLGDRTLKNRYITVFLCLVKGNYDAILAWPFHRKITFTLIDQQDDPTKRKNVVCSLLTSTSDSCCARPGPTTCVTELPGIARFVSHKNLKTNRYIVDDTLFLQVETDIPH